MLAEHYERGHEPGRAVTWYRRAAEQALAGNDMVASILRAEKGVACGADGEELGLLRLLLAESHGWLGENDAAAKHSRAAMDALAPGSEAWFSAAGEAAAALGKLRRYADLNAVADELGAAGATRELGGAHAIALARTAIQYFLFVDIERGAALTAELRGANEHYAGDPRVVAWIEEALAYQAFEDSDTETAVAHHLSAAHNYEQAGDVRNACLQQIDAADALIGAGLAEEAERVVVAAVPAAERMRLSAAIQFALGIQALALVFQGKTDEAYATATAAVAGFTSGAPPIVTTFALLALGLALRMRGDLAGAEARLREASAQGVRSVLSVRICLARVRLERGAPIEAIGLVREVLGEMPGFHYWKPLAKLVLAEALDAIGDKDSARTTLTRARECVLAGLARLKDPEWRRAYLEHMPGNARVVDLARAWFGSDTPS